MKLCSKCGLDIPVPLCYDRPLCQNCVVQIARSNTKAIARKKRAAAYKKVYEKRMLRLCQVKFEVWQEWIARVPDDYHTLTEDEWKSVVAYFDNKCAFCQLNDYTVRGMFLTFDQGGRYCDWNVVPLCDVCTVRPKNKNPFRFMDKIATGSSAVQHKRQYSKLKLDKIVKYLEPKLLAAARIDYSIHVIDASNVFVVE